MVRESDFYLKSNYCALTGTEGSLKIHNRMIKFLKLVTMSLTLNLGLAADESAPSQTWILDNLDEIGGHRVTVAGNPKVISTAHGKAIEFNGVDDALFLEVNPLAGMDTFTVEVIFRPYADGPKEQRFFHMQEVDSGNRVLFETRLLDNNRWFSDTFVQSNLINNVIYAEDKTHQLDRWYHDAIVVDGANFINYIIKVGPPVAGRPPRRSLRAVLPHKAPRSCLPSTNLFLLKY
jgi:hypothetical protein